MKTNYIELRRYLSLDAANDDMAVLEKNGIEYIVDSTKPDLDVTFTNGLLFSYIVKVRQDQLEEAKKVLYESTENMIGTHYMDAFSAEELMEVISKPEEWDENDLKYAQKLIKERKISKN